MKNARLLLAALLVAGLPVQRIHAASPAFTDANWVSMGALSGANGGVGDPAIDAAGNLYVIGDFTSLGGLAISNLAKWNGTNWSPMGTGFNGPVTALRASGTNLYVGGSFTRAGGIAATNIARWDGSSWSALGSGIDGGVPLLAVSGNDLYVALGAFEVNGKISLAKWDGYAWSQLGSWVVDGGSVSDLAVSGSNVYVAGYFASIGGVAANSVAKWNPVTGWSRLGSGIDDPAAGGVLSLAVSGGILYAGGNFRTAGGVVVNNVARWNGSAWSALGSGLDGNAPLIFKLAVSGSTLYAAGGFRRPGGTVGDGVAKWNGSSWSALGSGVGYPDGSDPSARALAASGTNVYVFGQFSRAGGIPVEGMARWNGSAWSSMIPPGISPPPLNGVVKTMAVWGTSLFVGGSFDPDNSVDECLARWDGSSWSPAGPGVGDVRALAAQGSDLYAAMYFTPGGGVSGFYLARWTGSSWTPLGGPVDASIFALAIAGTDIFVGGNFSTVDGGLVSSPGVAKWNGTSWSNLGTGVDGWVYALAVSGTNLFVGGSFTAADGVPATNIARWDGNTWSPLGSGLTGLDFPYQNVRALVVWNGDLYAGGYFTNAGGLPANYIARWNGTNWSALGSGLGNSQYPGVMALAASGANLYVGGVFNTAGGLPAANLAQWDGSGWSTLGSGADRAVNALAVLGSDLYAGGDFTLAGGKCSAYIARAYLVAPPGGIADSITASSGTATVRFYGNPGHQFDVQRAPSLAPPIVWTKLNVSPLSPGTNGLFTFTDSSAPNSNAYYRSVER